MPVLEHAAHGLKRFLFIAEPKRRPACAEAHRHPLQHTAGAVLQHDGCGQQSHADQNATGDRHEQIAFRFEPSQKKQPDNDIGQLRRQFDDQIDHGGDRGGKAIDTAEAQRARAQHIAADLRKWQHLGRGIAHQPAPDEFVQARVGRAMPDHPPCGTQYGRHRQMHGHHNGETMPTERRPCAADRLQTEAEHQIGDQPQPRHEYEGAEIFRSHGFHATVNAGAARRSARVFTSFAIPNADM